MQVRHGFSGVGPIIEDEPEPILREAELFGDFGCFEQEVSEDLVVSRLSFGDARDGFFGDDQDVSGRLGFDVAERDDFVIFVDDGSGDLAGNDLLEQCLAHDSATCLVDVETSNCFQQ